MDIRFTYPDGTPFRRRLKAPVESKSAAKRWGEARESAFLREPSPSERPPEEPKKEVPTLNDFGPRFVENYARANRQKASGIAAKESILKTHLYPSLGSKPLDAITDEDVQGLKAQLGEKSAKTVNNVLTVLSKLLKVAVKWKVIKTSPCTIELMKVAKLLPKFYEFSQYRALVEVAGKIDPRTLIVVLLGGDAGLRSRDGRPSVERRRLPAAAARHRARGLEGHRRHSEERARSHRSDDRRALLGVAGAQAPARRARSLPRRSSSCFWGRDRALNRREDPVGLGEILETAVV